MSINSEMTALADAIRDKSGVTGKLSISGMTTAVSNISVGGGESEPVDLSFITATAGDILSGKVGSDTDGNPVYGTLEITGGGDIDLSGVTVTADKMLSGIVAVGADGNKVTGNIQTVAASSDGEYVTVPAGFHASEQKFPITVTDGGGYDTSSVTATADTMLAGVIAIGKSGETITGNIQTVTPSVNKNTFTVGKGYVAEAFSQTIAESGASVIEANKVTVPAGFLSADRVETIPEATVTETDSSVTITPGYVAEELNYDKGSGGDAAGHRLVRVVYYNPPIEESFSAVYEIIVSGIGFVGYEDEEYPEDSYGEDYSELNGTYRVYDHLALERNPRNRIYKRTSNGSYFYISYFYDGGDESGWQISYNSPRSSGVLKIYNTNLFNSQTDETITATWFSPEYDAETEVTLFCRTAEYEQRGESVGVCDALVENAPTEWWNFENHDPYDTVPVLGGVYAAYQRKLIGRPVYMDAADGGKGIVLLTHFSELCQKIDDWTYNTEIVDEVGLCISLARSSNTDIIRSAPETPYIGSKFGTQFMRFDDLVLTSSGGLFIHKLPTLNAFTIEYWQFNNFEQNGTPEVGGVVLFDDEWVSGDLLDKKNRYLVNASNDRTKTFYKRWFHHAFTHGENSDVVKEYINGELVAEHEFRGTYRLKRYNEDQQEDEYEYTGTIGGDLFFCPGGEDGHGSNKAVCQLIIWNRDIGSNGVVQQSNCTRAIHYR